MKGVGRAVFVAVLFLIIGVLNIIYGIAAIGNAHFLTTRSSCSQPPHLGVDHGHHRRHPGHRGAVADGRRRLRRVIGIIAATIGAFESLLWSVVTPLLVAGIFALCVCVCTA